MGGGGSKVRNFEMRKPRNFKLRPDQNEQGLKIARASEAQGQVVQARRP